MIGEKGIILVGTALVTAFAHTIIPDHWLPFILIGKDQRWSLKKTVSLAVFSSLIHVVFSVGLGVLAYVVGKGAIMTLGKGMETMGGLFLIAFGILYPIWDWKWGHSHHHHHDEEEVEHADHLEWGPMKKNMTGLALAIVLGISPCVILVPLLVATIDRGMFVTIMVAVSFSLAVVVTMATLTVLGFKSYDKLHFTFMEKYGGVITGVLLVIVGIIFTVIH